ncbi:glycine-rich protein 5-like [Hibiscus syriacus]|uniref:glycine-rich protein 5-like n=1 Tax=Hibiscus syriacus TaxID=106335 RepID=UPI001924BC89|nr:glycine-rich protein 5-like [Hibiscus syriacus]
MAKYCNVVLILALAVVVQATARNVPNDAAGLNDQKNFLTYGGVGGYSGIGANGMPIGGVGSAGGITGLDSTGPIIGGVAGVGYGGGAGAGVGGDAGAGIPSTPGVIHFP